MPSESVPSYTLDVAGIATSGETPTYAARSVVSVRPGSKVSVSFTDFASGNPDRFYIDILSSSTPQGVQGSVRSAKFMLDRNFPFDVVFPSRVVRMSADAVRDLISYDPAKNVMAANLAAIYSRGFFDFDIVMHMAAEGTAVFTKTDAVPLLRIQALPSAESFFSKLSVRVEKPENPDLHRVVVSEDERIDTVGIMDLETGHPGGCDSRPYSLVANGSVIRSASGVQSYTGIDISAQYRVPANFPLWHVDDRATDATFRSSVSYPGSNPKLSTQIRHMQYNLENAIYFYDQVVTRRLQSERGYSGNHPLMTVQDLFDSCMPHDDGSPMLQFRREYTKNEAISNEQKLRRDINYMMYLDPLLVKASESSVPVFSVRLRRGAPRDMSCSLTWSVEGRRLLKNREEIHLEAVVEWGADGGAKKKRSRHLRVRRSVSDSHPWCRNTTYGSGEVDADAGYPMRLLTVQDMLEILKRNISGTVDGSSPFGDSGGGGLFPTFAEVGITNVPDPEISIVEFDTMPSYQGCYLLPAHRLTFGSRLMATGGEVGGINFGSTPSQFLCKGLEKNVSLDRLCCIMPLNRKLGEAGVRSSIKDVDSHIRDGDFDPDGVADNRFYRDWSLASAVRILREGRDYFAVRKRRPANEIDLAYGQAPPRMGRPAGAKCRLVGTAQLGMAVSFLELDAEGAGRFGAEAPSYLVSRISTAQPISAHTSSVESNVSSIGSAGVCLMYVDRPMFDNARTALSPGSPSDSIPGSEYPYGKSGSIWSVVYTTGSGRGIKSQERSLDGGYIRGSSALLDPMLHGSKYKTMSEGGELHESSRHVHVNPCFDLPGKLAPDSSFALEDLIDFGRASRRSAGNYAKVSTSRPSQPGICPIGGKGSKSINMLFSALKVEGQTEVKLSVNQATAKPIGDKVGDFEDHLWSNLGALARLMMSKQLERSELMPWLELDFSKYSYGNMGDNLDDPYLSQFPDPYLSFVDPYGDESLSPGSGQLREYSFRDINPKVGLRIKWRKRLVDPRSFSFFLRDRRFRSLADLRDEMNRRLGRFGIQTTSEVQNPQLRDQRNIFASDRISILSFVDTSSETVIEDPYSRIFITGPRSGDPYAVADPYLPVYAGEGVSLRLPAILSGDVDMADLSPSTAAQVVVHMRPFGGRRSPLVVKESSVSRSSLQDPAGRVTPPHGWSWSQDQINGMAGRVLRRDSGAAEGVPLLPDLPGGMTWKQLNQDVWYPSVGGIAPIPSERPRGRRDD